MSSPSPDRSGRRDLARSRRKERIRRRRLLTLAGFIAGAVLVVYALAGGSSGPAKSPGQVHAGDPAPASHRPRPAAPSAAANAALTASILNYTSYITAGSSRVPEVALTFDDGPGPYTTAVLRVLRQAHAQATFFETGREVRAHPEITRAVLAAGMPVGDHTQTHASLGHLTPGSQGAEIDGLSNALRANGLPQTTLFRPPYGSFNAATLTELHKRRMLMVLWSADTKDFSQPGVKRIIYVAVSGGKPGAIILLHDGGGNRAQTVAALPRIIQRLRQRGFRLVTVPQLLRDDPPPHGQRPPRNLAGN